MRLPFCRGRVLCLWAVLTYHGIFSVSSSAEAAVTRIEVQTRQAYAEGKSFPGVGPYERLTGRVYFEVDPRSPANRPIVDLELAPRNERGLVEFSADFDMLAPKDLSKSNGTLFYDVNNRGRRMCLRMFNEGADDFLIRKGYTVVWCGWIAEVLPIPDETSPGHNLLRMDAPAATVGDQLLTGNVRAEIMINEPATRYSISNRSYLGSHRPTQRGMKEATLTWRLRERDPRVEIPREQWHLEVEDISAPEYHHCLPKVELVLPAGLKPGYIYELIYEAQNPVVQGLGFAAIRDLISFLKFNTTEANPLNQASGRSAVSRAIGFGISQSGRCLRMLLYQGFNADEKGRQVFEGMIPHVAGGGLGFFNHRFAAPTRYATQHTNHLFPCDYFPFAYAVQTDHLTGKKDGLLVQARAADVVPKIMHIQNSAEYWNRSGSLVHTDTQGEKDAAIPPEVRIYAIGGAQHGWGDDEKPASSQVGQLPNNPTDYRPHLRAALTTLNDWIKDGTEPPPSVYPRIDQGTLVPRQETKWQPLPGVRYPEVIQQAELLDYGPRFFSEGQIDFHPPKRLGGYPVRVPACNRGNNDRGMLQLPAIAVPIATYTGWNLRGQEIGAENEMTMLRGAFLPFQRTEKDRKSIGDPRPALLERYESFEDYLQQFQAAAEELAGQRYLLKEDVPRLIERAKRNRWRFESDSEKTR